MNAQRERGFALPLVLVSVAITALSVLALMQAGYGRLVAVREETALLAADIAAESAQARLLLLFVTEPVGVRSLEVTQAHSAMGAPSERSLGGRRSDTSRVVLDGRPYLVTIGDLDAFLVVAELQDEAGLVNLNGENEDAIAHLLPGVGVAPADAKRLAATLADFIDADDLSRLEGADGPDYRHAGSGGARNRVLDVPQQALGSLGWQDAFSAVGATELLGETAALARSASFNPNTATTLALQAVFGIDAKAAERLISRREEQFLLSTDDVLALTGSARSRSHIRASVARSVRIRVYVHRGASEESYVYVANIAIAHEGADGPFSVIRLETPMRAGRMERVHVDDRAVNLPVSTALFAPRDG